MYIYKINPFITVFIAMFMVLYFVAFYIIIVKSATQRRFLRRFHNAVCNIYDEEIRNTLQKAAKLYSDVDSIYWFEQLNLNYEKLCQINPNNNYTSILDLLETVIYYYDSHTDDAFKNIFGREKEAGVRNFMVDMCFYIKTINPFISISRKEADLMQSIMNALNNNNCSLGVSSLKQLSQEVATKEKLIIKKDKENRRANIVSIVGLILTVFFGILSFLS